VSSLLLDTHAWYWWVNSPEKLARSQRAAIERTLKNTEAALLISIISCWELALLNEERRIRFSVPAEQWLHEASTVRGIAVVPLTLPIITTAARLTGLRDPADMLIVATAQHHGVPLVTNDSRIEAANLIRIVS